MGYLTVGKTIISTRTDTFNDPAGALDVVKWTLVDVGGGLPQTTRDVDSFGNEIREPTTALIAPHAYQLALVLNQPLTFRVSMSLKSTSRVGSGSGAFVTLFRPDLPAGSRIVGRAGMVGEGNNLFQMLWRGQSTNVAFTQTLDAYYRVGLEVDAEAGVARAYLNPTANTQTSAGDAALEFRISFAIDSGTRPFDDAPVYVGFGLSGSAANADDYSGADNVLLEEWRAPFTATFPGGAFFPMQTDPYTIHKSTLTLHEQLNRARLA